MVVTLYHSSLFGHHLISFVLKYSSGSINQMFAGFSEQRKSTIREVEKKIEDANLIVSVFVSHASNH